MKFIKHPNTIFFIIIITLGVIANIMQSNNELAKNIVVASIIIAIAGVFLYYQIHSAMAKGIKEKEAAIKKENETTALEKKRTTEAEKYIHETETIKKKLSKIKNINIIDISDFKKVISNNEKLILKKGGDNQLFALLKINSFLTSYRDKIISDIQYLTEDLPAKVAQLNLIINRPEITDNFQARSFQIMHQYESKTNFSKICKLIQNVEPSTESMIKTLEYYKNLALAMLTFFLNNKKIRYFEIYEAFEKLGVFDSTWQKNILGKLDTIEVRLTKINNELTSLNQNFISLAESSENLVSELKEINSSIMANNMLTAITAYQTWRININTRSLRQ